jgi:hypothetical protein
VGRIRICITGRFGINDYLALGMHGFSMVGAWVGYITQEVNCYERVLRSSLLVCVLILRLIYLISTERSGVGGFMCCS